MHSHTHLWRLVGVCCSISRYWGIIPQVKAAYNVPCNKALESPIASIIPQEWVVFWMAVVADLPQSVVTSLDSVILPPPQERKLLFLLLCLWCCLRPFQTWSSMFWLAFFFFWSPVSPFHCNAENNISTVIHHFSHSLPALHYFFPSTLFSLSGSLDTSDQGVRIFEPPPPTPPLSSSLSLVCQPQ